MKTNNNEIEGIKHVLGHLSRSEAERILDVVFGELLANPFLSEFERAHLEKRRRELLEAIEGKAKRAA